MKQYRAPIFVLATTFLSLGGCGPNAGLDQAGSSESPFAERIDARNDPNRVMLSLDLVDTFEDPALPLEGRSAKVPYPANWWPLRRDGINQRWDNGGLSPAEKYDRGFKGWTPSEGFMALRPFSAPEQEFDADYYDQLGPTANNEARHSGNWRARNGQDDDGDNEIDEADDWDGLESWFGHCNGWAAAAIMVNEPLHPVVHEGVRYEISDIKAYLTDAWYSTSSGFLASRCNRRPQDNDPDHEDDDSYYWSTDDDGRVVEDECRDTNAASLYLVATNLIGRHQRAFVIDSAFDWQVWNWPVYSYEINQQRRVDKAEAIRLLGESGEDYKHNDDAVAFAHVDMSISYVSDGISPHKRPVGHRVERYSHTDRFTMILELDAQDRVIGGEWSGSSKTNHPDFVWVPSSSRPWGSNPSIDYDDVELLLEKSRSGLGEAHGDLSVPARDANGVTLEATVADAAAGANRVQVFVEIDTSSATDLSLEVIAPDGRSALLKRAGSSAWGELNGWYPYDYSPAGDIDALAAAGGDGTWRLRVANPSGSSSAALKRFSVAIWSDGQTADDRDGDGDPDTSDCAPDDSTVHHGATEVCGDGVDNDCEGGDASCDDHGDDIATATEISAGQTLQASIEQGGDVDYFSFAAQAGHDYVIRTELAGLRDTKLTLYGSQGGQIAYNDDDGSSYASRITWSAPAAQKVYVKVEAYSASQTGTYNLIIEGSGGGPTDRDGDGDPDSSDCAPDDSAVFHGATEVCGDGVDNDCEGGDAACDDHADGPSGATPIASGAELNGEIEQGGDVDFFALSATAGVTYTATTALGSLSDTYLEVFAADGQTRVVYNDDFGGSYASQASFAASTTGIYYLKVRAYSAQQTGTYTLSVVGEGAPPPPPPPGDDHGDSSATATPVSRPSTTAGELEAEGDVDFFSFAVTGGQTVTVRTALGSLSDTVLELYDASGAKIAENDDADGGLASRIVHTPYASGTLYAKVRAYSAHQVGSYELLIE